MPSGTPTNRTNIELPSEVSSVILQKAQDQSAIMQLATRMNLPGWGLTIPVITSDPEAEWVSETGAKPVKNPGLSKKVMQAYKLAVIVPFSEEFRRDAASLYNALVNRLPLALAKKFDETVIHGSAPGSNFDVLGSCTAQDIGAAPYASLVAAMDDIADAGGVMNGFVISPKAKSTLLLALDLNQRPIFLDSVAQGSVPMILGCPTHLTKAAYKAAAGANPAVVGVAGDWTQALYGIAQGMKVSISDQATLTLADSSTINLWQNNMFAVRAEIEVGFRADTDCFDLLTQTVSGATGATGATGNT